MSKINPLTPLLNTYIFSPFEVPNFSHFEIDPVMEGDGFTERCEPHEADYWGVYVRLTEGGASCIADCATKEAAEALVTLLEGLLKAHQPEEKQPEPQPTDRAYIVAYTSIEDEMDYYHAFIDDDSLQQAERKYNELLQDDDTSIASLCLVLKSTDYDGTFNNQDVQPFQSAFNFKMIEYAGSKFRCREITTKDEQIILVAPNGLNDLLTNEITGDWEGTTARYVGEQIYGYFTKQELETLTDQELEQRI